MASGSIKDGGDATPGSGTAVPAGMDKPPSAWSMIRPYWFSEDKRRARTLLLLVIALNLAIVYVNVRINVWYAAFYDDLDKRNLPGFTHEIMVFGLLAFVFIGLATARIYFRQMLEFRWRRWLTDVYLGRWLGARTFYQLERDHAVDNPDQRIAEDLRDLASNSLALSLDLLSTIVTLVSFVTILWVLSGTLSFALFGHQMSIPGYMVWAALLYAVIGTLVIHKVSRRLVDVSYRQQKVEADFRVLLVRLRENAEQIAFYDGGPTEGRRARAAFGAVRNNWVEIMRYTKRLVLASSIYGQIAIIFPLVAAAPRYFAGAFTLGVLMRLNDTFGQVSGAFSWFINSYSTLADWRATVNRLREFNLRMDRQPSPGLTYHRATDVQAHGLQVFLPDGKPLPVPADFHIRAGERWLVRGPSGAGKSTLLRALAGLWPYATGDVSMPDGALAGGGGASRPVLFLPQMSYVPDGTLKEALCYPMPADRYTDAQCAAALRDCRLEAYVDQLQHLDAWSNRLSPGEQQRLAFARALLLRPSYLFMDEATSSLDLDTEQHLYETLLKQLPETALISVAHRETLERYHTHEMRIGPQASVHPLQGQPA